MVTKLRQKDEKMAIKRGQNGDKNGNKMSKKTRKKHEKNTKKRR